MEKLNVMLRRKVIRYRLNKIPFHVLPLEVQVPLFIDLIQNAVKNIQKKSARDYYGGQNTCFVQLRII